MATEQHRRGTKQWDGSRLPPCMPLTPEVLGHLQVCLTSVELLAGTSLSAESVQSVERLTQAVEGLVAAAAVARSRV